MVATPNSLWHTLSIETRVIRAPFLVQKSVALHNEELSGI